MSKAKTQEQEEMKSPLVKSDPKPVNNQGTPISQTTMADAQTALEEAMMELIHSEPFYANLTLNMRREFTTKFPTLAVNVTDEINLFINPFFFMHLSIPERVEVIKHECLHVINNHMVRFRDLEPQIYDDNKTRSMGERMNAMQTASVLNQAADYAVNEYLPKLPKNGVKMFDKDGNAMVYPPGTTDDKGKDVSGKEVEGKLLFVNDLKKQHPSVLNEQNFEYYYEILKKEQEKQKGKGQQDQQGGQGQGQGQPQPGNGQPQPGSGMTLDDHSAWHESDATEDQITEKVKEMVNKAVEQTSAKDMGNVPGHIVKAIHDLNHVPKDWRQDIQRFVARTTEILIETTRKKRNRRYGVVFPGYKIQPKLKIAVGLDTSGSVGDEELTQFHSEICRLHNMGIDILVIECDTRVNQVYTFDPKKEFKVMGRGGTAFAPMFAEADKHEIDGLIYMTDGECWGEKIPTPKYTVLWALTPPFNAQHLPKWYNGGTKAAPHTKIEIRKRVRR